MADDRKTCFVVMGFGEKTDYKTSRVLDLNKTYRYIIKPAVVAAGLKCVRADEIAHAGTIDVPMYEMLLDADLVIADLSTSNLNAAYELGIRHALRPATTIIIAESLFDAPFDVNHISIRRFRHDGKALDIEEAERFRDQLQQAIADVMANGRTDSPVYTFLNSLAPPARRAAVAALAAAAPAADFTAPTLAGLMEGVQNAIRTDNWAIAKRLLLAARALAPNDESVVQKLALVTYKNKQPDALAALLEAHQVLQALNPQTCNDAETLGLWGAVHKRLFELQQDRAALDTAVQAHEKGYWLLNDHYNGINLAFLLDTRAPLQADRNEAIADAVLARRTRAAVVGVCAQRLAALEKQRALLDSPEQEEAHYWLLATQAEAALGLGDDALCQALLAKAKPLAKKPFMVSSTTEQLDKLRQLLAASPLRRAAHA